MMNTGIGSGQTCNKIRLCGRKNGSELDQLMSCEQQNFTMCSVKNPVAFQQLKPETHYNCLHFVPSFNPFFKFFENCQKKKKLDTV